MLFEGCEVPPPPYLPLCYDLILMKMRVGVRRGGVGCGRLTGWRLEVGKLGGLKVGELEVDELGSWEVGKLKAVKLEVGKLARCELEVG